MGHGWVIEKILNMKFVSFQFINILLLCFLFGAIDRVYACTSIPTTPQYIVQNAEIIVRAKVIEKIEDQKVKLKVNEVLRGTNVPNTLVIHGFLTNENGFNRGTVPYQSAYSNSGGLCNSKNYKEGGEYLLLLIRRDGELTPYWGSGFAPTHEQLRSTSDQWIIWVKEFLKFLETATEAQKLEIRFELWRKFHFMVDDEALWGYSFVDSNREKLQRLAKHLESLGYTIVNISEVKSEEYPGEFELQIKKIEKHSPATLAQRNKEFRALAATFDIRKYNEGSFRVK